MLLPWNWSVLEHHQVPLVLPAIVSAKEEKTNVKNSRWALILDSVMYVVRPIYQVVSFTMRTTFSLLPSAHHWDFRNMHIQDPKSLVKSQTLMWEHSNVYVPYCDNTECSFTATSLHLRFHIEDRKFPFIKLVLPEIISGQAQVSNTSSALWYLIRGSAQHYCGLTLGFAATRKR